MSDQEEIEAMIGRFVEAYNAGDVAGVMSCYDATLIKLRQGAPPESRGEAERRIAQVMARYAGHLKVRNDEILISGELAVVRGELWIDLTPRAGGESQSIQRRFLEVWRKTHGEWLVFRTMDNSDQPT